MYLTLEPYSVRLVTTLVLEPLLHDQVEGRRGEAKASENKTRVTGFVLLYIYYTSPGLSSNRIFSRYPPMGYEPEIRR